MTRRNPIEDQGDPPARIQLAPVASGHHSATAPSQSAIETGAGRLMRASWRQRRLLIIPLLILTPLTVIASLIAPRTFSAQTLLLMPSGRDNPLARESAPQAQQREMASALTTFLKSERVLRSVLVAETPEFTRPTAAFEEALEDLRSDLSLTTVGSDFISLGLKNKDRNKVADRLQRITVAFLSALADVQNMPTAGGLISQTASPNGTSTTVTPARSAQANAAAGRIGSVSALLPAIERIRVVDLPREPTSALNSRFLHILAGIGAALGLGVVLAISAELFDGRLRDAEDFSRICGVPVVARFSETTPAAEVTGCGPSASAVKSLSFIRLFALLVALSAIVGIGIASGRVIIVTFGVNS